MINTATITCTIGTTDAGAALGLEAWVDDRKFFDSEHVTQSQQLSVEVDDSQEQDHELRFVLKNKLPEHTKIDSAGDIVSDARLTVTDIGFDAIDPGHMIVEQAVYTHDFNGTGAQGQHKFYGEMGCNGTVSLKFTHPCVSVGARAHVTINTYNELSCNISRQIPSVPLRPQGQL
jgi:hypothetical protein